MAGRKTTKKNPNKIRNQSVTNKISSTVITLSKAAGFGLSLAPKSFRGLRVARGRALGLQRYGRDINSLAKGKIGARINNRVKGRLGGLAVNAVLPNTNNVVLRLARAQIGSYLNKAIHKRTKGFNILEVFGPKATAKAHQQIFNTDTGTLFSQMQNQLAFSLRALAPRTEFTMNIGGTVVQFGPNNLADSVMIHAVEKNPEENVIAKWAVSVGGTSPDSLADKAPYVWIANYGGVLFNPLEPDKNKPYGPTFFAERSLEFIERTYRPVIKKMYEIFTPKKELDKIAAKNMKMDPSKFMTRSYSETHKRLQKIWLSKDGEALEKQIELQQAKKGGKTVSTSYSSQEAGNQDFMEYYEKYFGVKEYDKTGRMFLEAQEDGAMAAMRVMYGDEYYEKITEKEVLKKTKPTNQRRTRVKVQTVEKIPYAITSGTGRVPIYADMRELKNKNSKYVAGRGANSHYKNTVIEPAKVSLQKDYRFDLGEVVITDEVDKLLKKLKREGVIDTVRDTKTGKHEIEVLDVDRFIKELEIQTIGPGTTGDANYIARGKDPSEIVDSALKEVKGRGVVSTGNLAKGSNQRGTQTFLTTAEEQVRAQAEVQALRAIVDEVNKQLPPQITTKKVRVAGHTRKKGITNRQHLHTLSPQNRRHFRAYLRNTGQKLDDEFFTSVEGYSKTVTTQTGFFSVEIDKKTGRAKVVSDTDKQLIKSRDKVVKLENKLEDLKDSADAEIRILDKLGKAEGNITESQALAGLKKQGYAVPTDPDVPQVFWSTSATKAPATYELEGFGTVKKGQRIPVSPDPSKKVSDVIGAVGTGVPSAKSSNVLNKISKQITDTQNELKREKATLASLTKQKNREAKIFGTDKPSSVKIQGRSFRTGRGTKVQNAGIKAVNKHNSNNVANIFKGVNVSGTSGKINSRGNIVQKDIINTDAFRAIATADDQGLELPTLSFVFKSDISKNRAQELGLFAYTAKLHKPKLGGGHAARGRTIKPIVDKKATGAIDLIYKDPALPTAQLVLRQRFVKQGAETTVRYEDQRGSKITPVTSRRAGDDIQTQSLFDDLMFLQSGINDEKIEKPRRRRTTGGFQQNTLSNGSIVLRFEDR